MTLLNLRLARKMLRKTPNGSEKWVGPDALALLERGNEAYSEKVLERAAAIAEEEDRKRITAAIMARALVEVGE